MQEKQANFFRFDDLSIQNYGVFAEPIYFTFDRQRTLIVGEGHGISEHHTAEKGKLRSTLLRRSIAIIL